MLGSQNYKYNSYFPMEFDATEPRQTFTPVKKITEIHQLVSSLSLGAFEVLSLERQKNLRLAPDPR